MTELMDGQMSLFDHDFVSGRMSGEHSRQTAARTSAPSSRNSAKSAEAISQFLNLTSGCETELCWEINSPLLGAYTMQKTGAFPSQERGFALWQILEDNAPQKYCLSAKAAQGILNRAAKRGKTLPEILQTALMSVISKEGQAELFK